MSDSAGLSEAAQEVLALWSPQLIQNYVFLSSFALTFYDYFLTLPSEVGNIWSSELSTAKVLYFMNRYGFMAYQICQTILFFGKPNDAGCNDSNLAGITMGTTAAFGINAIFTLRTFAIYQKNYVVLALLGALTLAILATDLQLYTEQSSAVPAPYQLGPLTCSTTVANNANQWYTASWAVSLAFDTLVFLLTFAKTIRIALAARRLKLQNSLVSLILRDGFLYYIVILVPAILQIILSAAFGSTSNAILSFGIANLAIMINTVQVLVVSRLVLNLRQKATESISDSILATISGLAEPQFAPNSFLGNIGAPLRSDLGEIAH